MRLDFSIIGAAKSGTTALHEALDAHPAVFQPARKELNFWAYDDVRPGLLAWGSQPEREWPATTFDEYAAYFADAPAHAVCGEASVVYLESEHAPARLAAHNPAMRLIALLRNPIDRANSGYWMSRRNGWTADAAHEAFDVDRDRIQSGRYGFLLQRYHDEFPADQIFVARFEELRDDAAGLLGRVQDFLGLERHASSAGIAVANAGGVPKSATMHRVLASPQLARLARPLQGSVLHRAVRRVRGANLAPTPPVPVATRRTLVEYYRSDLEHLSELTGLDCSSWLRVETG